LKKLYVCIFTNNMPEVENAEGAPRAVVRELPQGIMPVRTEYVGNNESDPTPLELCMALWCCGPCAISIYAEVDLCDCSFPPLLLSYVFTIPGCLWSSIYSTCYILNAPRGCGRQRYQCVKDPPENRGEPQAKYVVTDGDKQGETNVEAEGPTTTIV